MAVAIYRFDGDLKTGYNTASITTFDSTATLVSVPKGGTISLDDVGVANLRLNYIMALSTDPTPNAPLAQNPLNISTAPTEMDTPVFKGGIWITEGKKAATVNLQAGTAYTLAATDVSKTVEMNNAGAMTLTVPTNASVPFPIGTEIHILRSGAGTLTITPAGGVTLPNKIQPAGTTARTVTTQMSLATLRKRNTNEWVLLGDLT